MGDAGRANVHTLYDSVSATFEKNLDDARVTEPRPVTAGSGRSGYTWDNTLQSGHVKTLCPDLVVVVT